jgi:hypothetical protein
VNQRGGARNSSAHARFERCIRNGDTLVVTHIDCLARTIGDLQTIVRAIRARRYSPLGSCTPVASMHAGLEGRGPKYGR